MQEIAKIIRRYCWFAFAFQVISYKAWANRMQWKRAVRSGIKIGSLCLVVVICWWTVAVGKLNLLNWPLPFFILVVLLNLFFIGIPLFKMPGIFSIPDRAPLLNSNAALDYREVADPTPNKFVLGDRGKACGGYWWVDWNSPIFEQHWSSIGGMNYGRDYLKNWFLFCASANRDTICLMLDANARSGESFAAFAGKDMSTICGGVLVLEEPHKIAKAMTWLLDRMRERSQSRLNGHIDSPRIVVFIDETLTELVYSPDSEPPSESLLAFGRQMQEVLISGKGHNIHVVMAADPMRLPSTLPREIQPRVMEIVYSYAIPTVDKDGKPFIATSKHPPRAYVVSVWHHKEEHVLKIPFVPPELVRTQIEAQFNLASKATHEMFRGLIEYTGKRKYQPREKREIMISGETVAA